MCDLSGSSPAVLEELPAALLETSQDLSAVPAFCTLMELDAQEQRIYQLQTKQRERQAELEQKCSRIQQLSQDLRPAISCRRKLRSSGGYTKIMVMGNHCMMKRWRICDYQTTAENCMQQNSMC
ncbi:uncharacterized protein ACIB01_000993 [Guaruba guarouba]